MFFAAFPSGDKPVTVYNIIEEIFGQVGLIELVKVINEDYRLGMVTIKSAARLFASAEFIC